MRVKSHFTSVSDDLINTEPTTVILLHYLGGSAESWRAVSANLPRSLRVIALDLPGFGDVASGYGYTVAEMADFVADRIRAERPKQWMIVGHSMGAKVAAAVARMAEDGDSELAGLAHLILVAGSPPGSEPMSDTQRDSMAGWFGDGPETSRAQAEAFIDNNIAGPIDPAIRSQAMTDLLRCAQPAWVAWLRAGSLEDWTARIGVLHTPALLIAGGNDADLGMAAQRRLMAPHFRHHHLHVLEEASHLLPQEQPEAIARLIAAAANKSSDPVIPPAYRALIASERVSARTCEVLLARAPNPPASESKILNDRQLVVLRVALTRILPQDGAAPIDLAAAIARMLDDGAGDGWRIATQPPDVQAYRAALNALDDTERPFTSLTPAEQDDMLRQTQAGRGPAGEMSATQMAAWFSDFCATATRLYVSHPATLARLGFSGIGYGGDTERLPGFSLVGLGEHETWEPEALP